MFDQRIKPTILDTVLYPVNFQDDLIPTPRLAQSEMTASFVME